jgi:hypothetical protein
VIELLNVSVPQISEIMKTFAAVLKGVWSSLSAGCWLSPSAALNLFFLYSCLLYPGFVSFISLPPVSLFSNATYSQISFAGLAKS